jgi:pSer/pThr/pTyr-binding forkhead associated (FHA) protein
MSATVKLTVTAGKLKGKEVSFGNVGRYLVGRAKGCDVRFPGDWEHSTISRLHCLFEVDPPELRVWDIGSRNGTFVNGKRIGPGAWPPAGDVDEGELPGCPLHDGDELRVGNVAFHVHIEPEMEATEFVEVADEADCVAMV